MKTQLIALIAFVASTPAGASINISEATPLAITPQPVAFQAEPVVEPHTLCGEPEHMIFILRDPSGAIVAMGVAEVPAAC